MVVNASIIAAERIVTSEIEDSNTNLIHSNGPKKWELTESACASLDLHIFHSLHETSDPCMLLGQRVSGVSVHTLPKASTPLRPPKRPLAIATDIKPKYKRQGIRKRGGKRKTVKFSN